MIIGAENEPQGKVIPFMKRYLSLSPYYTQPVGFGSPAYLHAIIAGPPGNSS